MYGLTLITPPTSEPVTTDELKAHLRLNTTNEDGLLPGFISSARSLFEHHTDRAVMPQQWQLAMDAWPAVIRLPRAPLTSVDTIQYWDSNNVLQTLTGDHYTVDASREPGRVVAFNGWPGWGGVVTVFPSLSYMKSPKVLVNFTAGYATVPPLVKQAVLLTAAHFFKNREATLETDLKDLPLGYRNIVQIFRLNWQTNMNPVPTGAYVQAGVE